MRRRAFTLLEILVLIALIGFVSVIAMRLFRATLRTWRESAADQTAQLTFDHAISQLRNDVWSASSIDVANAHSISFKTPAGLIRWESDEHTGLTRAASQNDQMNRWPALGRLTFAGFDSGVIVQESAQPLETGRKLILMSQQMLLERIHR